MEIMTTEDLNFIERNGRFEASFSCTGACMVQLMRRNNAPRVLVYANLPGMDPVVVDQHKSRHSEGIIFGIDMPGTEITIASTSEVSRGVVMFY